MKFGTIKKEESVIENCALRKSIPKRVPLKLDFAYITVIVFGLIFLMNESRKFYQEFNFGAFNSVLLPLLVEVFIILLALQKELRAKILMSLLVIYNVISFSFYTVSDFDKKSSELMSIEKKETLLKEDKKRIQKQYQSIEVKLSKTRDLYDKAIRAKLITKANKTYLPVIKNKEKAIGELSRKLEGINKELSTYLGHSIYEVLLVGCLSLIFLKLILQVVIIYFIGRFGYMFKCN